MPSFPIVAIGSYYLRCDHVSLVANVEDEPDYVEVFFLAGHRAIFHRDEAAPLLAWLDAQVRHTEMVLAPPFQLVDAVLEVMQKDSVPPRQGTAVLRE